MDKLVKRNYNIRTSQDEWLYAKATAQRISQSAALRDVLARAMAAESRKEEGRIEMDLGNLIGAVCDGLTLRQALGSVYDKPAEQISVEGADLDEYRHDLDKPVVRVYAAFDHRGRLTGDVALVAGNTIWQDCGTMDIVTSIDEETVDAFKQAWVRIWPSMDAVLTHNNACDTVLVAYNGSQSAPTVDAEVFRAFVGAEEGVDWADWGSPDNWAEYGDTIGEAAPKYGQIVAYYDDQALTIVDPRLWAERREFYGLDR